MNPVTISWRAQDAVRGVAARLHGRRALIASLVVVAAFCLLAALAGLLPLQPNVPDYSATLAGPSLHHLLGTDEYGRDTFTRLAFGARVTLRVAFLATMIATALGSCVGLITGYFGGFADAVSGRIIDALFAFPALLLAIALTAILGPSEVTALIAITVILIPEFARISRNAVLAEKTQDYVEASRALGSSSWYIVFRCIVPNLRGTLIVLLTMGFSEAVLYENALSFLGLAAQPPTASWGWMLSDGRQYMSEDPWYALTAGGAIFVLLMAVNIAGDGLRSIFGAGNT